MVSSRDDPPYGTAPATIGHISLHATGKCATSRHDHRFCRYDPTVLDRVRCSRPQAAAHAAQRGEAYTAHFAGDAGGMARPLSFGGTRLIVADAGGGARKSPASSLTIRQAAISRITLGAFRARATLANHRPGPGHRRHRPPLSNPTWRVDCPLPPGAGRNWRSDRRVVGCWKARS